MGAFMKTLRVFALSLMVAAFSATITQGPPVGDFGLPISHSGGTDKCGCHRNSKTGEYHCHTRKKRGGDCPPQADKQGVQKKRMQPGDGRVKAA